MASFSERQAKMSNALTAQAAFLCDICGEQIDMLRLIKWRESGQVIRYWVCLKCWKEIYHSETAADDENGLSNRFLSVSL